MSKRRRRPRTVTYDGAALLDRKGRMRLFARSADILRGAYALSRELLISDGDPDLIDRHMRKRGWSIAPAMIAVTIRKA